MCGIYCSFIDGADICSDLTHRGPDAEKIATLGECTMKFFRLSINDTSSNGMQPFVRDGAMLVCNGEIYNHTEFKFDDKKSASDCECLIPAIQKHGIFNVSHQIRGVFAMCYTDGKTLLASRDPIGVRPLFYVKTKKGIHLASEIKAFSLNTTPQIFPPGHVYDSKLDKFICYFKR